MSVFLSSAKGAEKTLPGPRVAHSLTRVPYSYCSSKTRASRPTHVQHTSNLPAPACLMRKVANFRSLLRRTTNRRRRRAEGHTLRCCACTPLSHRLLSVRASFPLTGEGALSVRKRVHAAATAQRHRWNEHAGSCLLPYAVGCMDMPVVKS